MKFGLINEKVNPTTESKSKFLYKGKPLISTIECMNSQIRNIFAILIELFITFVLKLRFVNKVPAIYKLILDL